MKKLLLGVLIVFTAGASVFAQDSGKKKMTMLESLLLPNWSSYTWSPDGKSIAFIKTARDPEDFESTGHIWIYDVESEKSFQLTNSHTGESNPQWKSDGKLVFTSKRDGKQKMYVIPITGGEAVLLSDSEDAPVNGTLSKDGTKILYTKMSDRPDKEEWEKKKKKKDDGYFWEEKLTYRHVWVFDIETSKAKRITEGEFDNSSPVWSPCGKWIVFRSNRSGNFWREDNNHDLWIVSADSGAVRQLTTNEGPDGSAVFSHDGKWIAYTMSRRINHRADQMEVAVIPFEGGSPTVLTDEFDYSVSGLKWSIDGSTIFFNAGPGPSNFLYSVPAAGGSVTKVSPDNEFYYRGFELSEDGTKWVVTGSSWKGPGEVFTSDVSFSNIKNILSPTNHMGEFEVAKEEVINFKGAGGWDITGIITYPLGYEEGKKYPTILMVHGGPYGMYNKGFSSGTQIWAARGYAIIRTNPRGSRGFTLKFGEANVEDWGGKDFQDIMAGVDYIIERGIADPDRMGVMGGSYGGFMTFWTVTQTDRFKAAIGHAAIADWFSFYGQTDIPQLLKFGFGGHPWQTKKIYEKWSPIEFVENVKTPLLITHGDEDYRVNLQQGWQFYRSLMMLRKDVKMLRFPREGHGIREPRHRLHLDREQEIWFEKYILPEKYTERVTKESK